MGVYIDDMECLQCLIGGWDDPSEYSFLTTLSGVLQFTRLNLRLKYTEPYLYQSLLWLPLDLRYVSPSYSRYIELVDLAIIFWSWFKLWQSRFLWLCCIQVSLSMYYLHVWSWTIRKRTCTFCYCQWNISSHCFHRLILRRDDVLRKLGDTRKKNHVNPLSHSNKIFCCTSQKP